MDRGVGTILREARRRREIEFAEVEAATRIRLRYLSAIEHEEWDVLPGGVYTRGFIRTYASFLGLDGARLAEDYREEVEKWQRGPLERAGADLGRPERTSTRLSTIPAAALAIAGVVAVAAVAIVAIPGSGDGGGVEPVAPPHPAEGRQAKGGRPSAPQPRPGVSIRLAAKAEVWVCLVDGKGEKLVDGQILGPGAEEGPFRSGSFTVSFGNGEVSMLIDGREAKIPATSSPIGYAIDSSGRSSKLGETERPSCS